MSWSEEQEALAVKCWTKEGMSAAEIANLLPGKSRNAVIGKLTRLGAAGQGARKSGQRAYRQQPAAPSARVRPQVKLRAVVVKFTPPPIVERAEDGMTWPLTPTATALLKLQGCHCRWPVGTATGAEQMFCGAQRGEGPYCPSHAVLSGSPMTPKEWARKNARTLKLALAS